MPIWIESDVMISKDKLIMKLASPQYQTLRMSIIIFDKDIASCRVSSFFFTKRRKTRTNIDWKQSVDFILSWYVF